MGKLETPKSSGKYETGQLLLHRVFGYRGVILFPWAARVYDRDLADRRRDGGATNGTSQTPDGLAAASAAKEVKGRTHTFYQVLIDSRDGPFIVSFSIELSKCGTKTTNLTTSDIFI